MKGYKQNIEKLTLANENFRQVVYTAKFSQLVLMCLKVGEEIGEEVHDVDQFFRFEHGIGQAVIDGNVYDVADGDAVIVPAGSRHNIINVSKTDSLKLYTLYSPPHHQDGIIRATKVEGMVEDEHFDGQTSE